mmetsp:Transcript_101491/g.176487  ORF Transcript_101491/g.176487 Transcript_101491/m.176487 type:complete len:159 (-) Transcript_101491:7-483(-)
MHSSSSDSSSTAGEDVLVLLAGVTARRSASVPLEGGLSSVPKARAKPGPYWNKSVSLQQTLSLVRNGIRSNGSLAHNLGTCSACVFETRYRRGSVVAPCRNGMLCDRCHEPHDTSHSGRRRRRTTFISGAAGSASQAGTEEADTEDLQLDSEDNVWSV